MVPTVDNEAVREALVNLERSRQKEQVLREQANHLLEGLEIITSATGTTDMLGRLLGMVTQQLKCEDAFILSPLPEEVEMECIGTTHPAFAEAPWRVGQVFRRVLDGHSTMLFSVDLVEEWQQQRERVRELSCSALLVTFPGVNHTLLLCCVSRQRAFFNRGHLGLMQRLMPITSHALHTLYINEQLQREIDERNRLEQYASFQAGIAEMSASVLHNIGNTITGAQGHLIKIGHQREHLLALIPILQRLEQWMGEEVTAERQENILKVLSRIMKLLHQTLSEDGVIDGAVQAIERSILHVSEIIQMQRGVSMPVLTASRFEIQQMVDDTLVMIEESIEKRQITMEVEILPPLNELCLPRNPMIQMLLNLVKNSVESIDERYQDDPESHGRIEVRFEPVDEYEGDWFRLSVSDNGMGVERDRLDSIFQFGVSSKERGSGFGLHSVANFVTSVGGRIEMRSEGHLCGAEMVLLMPVEMED